ncbi:MAG: nucleoside-triphosphatase, partial [Spirochaetaceae bacterium]|nr:nucleoside-triphosphatase [Spirochaetaceae bacterium]
MKPRPLVVLTGARGEGKTYACVAVARRAAELGFRVGGFVSRSERDEGGLPTSIRIEDIVTGESRLLARRGAQLGGPSWPPSPGRIGGPEPFGFSTLALAWAIELARRALESGPDLVIVDEIGPVELEQGEGLFPLLAA